MCRRPAIEMDTFNAAMDNCALAMREIEASRSTLGAAQAERRMLQKASRAGQIPRPLATMLIRGMEIIEGGIARQLAYDGQDYDLSLVLTSGVVALQNRKPLAGGSRSAALKAAG